MSDNQNKGDKIRPKVEWTAEDRARHRAIRDTFRDWHPSPEELIASGDAANFELQGEYRELRPFVQEIKRVREAAGLTLAEVSRRCGHRPAGAFHAWRTGTTRTRRLTRSGVTLPQSAGAWCLTTEAIRDTRPEQGKAKRFVRHVGGRGWPCL